MWSARRQHSPSGVVGFTLAELMVTVAIVSILAAVALPQFQKTIRRGHHQAAEDILRTIYAGEQVYESINNTFLPLTVTSPSCNDPINPDWCEIFMDNPNVAASPLPVTFTVTTPTATTFTATATYTPPEPDKTMSIDQSQTIVGGDDNAWD